MCFVLNCVSHYECFECFAGYIRLLRLQDDGKVMSCSVVSRRKLFLFPTYQIASSGTGVWFLEGIYMDVMS